MLSKTRYQVYEELPVYSFSETVSKKEHFIIVNSKDKYIK